MSLQFDYISYFFFLFLLKEESTDFLISCSAFFNVFFINTIACIYMNELKNIRQKKKYQSKRRSKIKN